MTSTIERQGVEFVLDIIDRIRAEHMRSLTDHLLALTDIDPGDLNLAICETESAWLEERRRLGEILTAAARHFA